MGTFFRNVAVTGSEDYARSIQRLLRNSWRAAHGERRRAEKILPQARARTPSRCRQGQKARRGEIQGNQRGL